MASQPLSSIDTSYDVVERWLRESIELGRSFLFDKKEFEKELQRLWETYDFPYHSLLSFVRNLHVSHVKRRAGVVKSSLPEYLDKYKKGLSILHIARTVNYPPYLLARLIVEVVAGLGGNKKKLADAVRDPRKELYSIDVIVPEFHETEVEMARTNSTRLAHEVEEAVASDPMYGSMHDMRRHLVGIEFEVVLEKRLAEMGIPFETESQLRDRGTAKTPDILLACPVGVKVPSAGGTEAEWKVVCWIDSKALFGDVSTHQNSVLPQAQSYVNRFGPGLVLYWFGHAPRSRLCDTNNEVVVAAFDLPDTFLFPGAFGNREG